MKNYEKEYCMKCGKTNPHGREVCECGGRNFVFGNNFNYTKEKGVICDCGNNKFEMVFHLNMNPIYEKTYKCKCGNRIGVQVYCKR
jgi:hypothetical protein